MKKVVYVSGTRADFGLMRRTLHALQSDFLVTVLATGMHLSQNFGYTVDDIRKEFPVRDVECLLDGDSPGSMVRSLGLCTYGMGSVVEEVSPDLLFVEGDRGEALAGAVAGSHLNIPVIHHGGGDLSGSVDNRLRWAVTELSDYHLVGNPSSYDNLVRRNVNPSRIFLVGEPGIDDIVAGDYPSADQIQTTYSLRKDGPVFLLLFHPDTRTHEHASSQILLILESLKEFRGDIIAIGSNADAGGRSINRVLESQKEFFPSLQLFRTVSRRDFLGLMNVCDVMVGNSSAGIIELPSLKKPFVCIGSRQAGRLTAGNVIEAGFERDQIREGMRKALYDEEFRTQLKSLSNPYGDGTASRRIRDAFLRISGDSDGSTG